LKITNSSPRRVVAGRSFTLKFETDARPDYFVNPDNFIAVLSPPSLGQYTGTANVRDGYGVAYFKSRDDIGVGTQGKIVLEVRPPRAPALSDSIEIEIVDPPLAAGPEEGQSRTPNINPHWVSQGDAFWIDNDWTTKSVARVTREEDSIDIYVSADNERLSQVIARAQRRNLTAVDIIKNFYLEHVSFFALLQDIERGERSKATPLDADDDGSDTLDVSLRHACETVCGIIEGMFDVLVASDFS
jgi:hypothetical protein